MKDYSPLTDDMQVAIDDDEPISVTEQEVIKKLLEVNTFRAGGPDDLSNWVLKEFAVILAEPITDILNTSFSKSKVPRVWKLADIAPLPKASIISDYNKDLRPISLTSTLSKIAESFVIEKSLKPVVLSSLDPCQYGFIPRSSTTFALISMLHHWLHATDATGATIRTALLDFRKAFDLVDHQILISKLFSLGVKPTTVNWIIDFLRNRQQRVKLNGNCYSDWLNVPAGVAQGTRLGPWLFLVMINDLKPIGESLFMWKFADDVTISEIIPGSRASHLQQAVDLINIWSHENRLELKPSKCKEILTCFKKTPTSYAQLEVNGLNFQRISSATILGVIVRNDFKWNDHVGEFWSKLKPLLPNSKLRKLNSMVLIENDKVFTQPKDLAEIFNKYFIEAVDNDVDEAEPTYADHPSIIAIKERISNQTFNFRTVAHDYILSIITGLDEKKSTGVDGISAALIKISAPVIVQPITELMNYFIRRKAWPTEWKSSNVTPAHKKDEETDKKNYRPISILPILSKVYERVMYDQIFDTFGQALSSNLSGFLKGHSCTTALLKMTEDWRVNLDEGKTVAIVAVDLSKAFDSVNHKLLIAKLEAYGFDVEALKLMRNYLFYRRQRVKINGMYSEWRTVKTGLPQGTLLGPLLFNIFMNDLNYFISKVSLRLYADDTTEYFADYSPMILEYTINNELNTLSEWFNSNNLTANPSKTQALILRPTTYNYDLKMDELTIEIKESLNMLGVNMDDKLKLSAHVKEQLKKAYAKCAALRRLKKMVESEVMIKLYKAYILPHLEYCSPLLLGITKTLSDKIEDANYYMLRTLLGLAKSNTYEFVLTYAGMKSLIHRRRSQSLVLLFKCIRGSGPGYLRDFFETRLTPYNLRGSRTKVKEPSFKTNYMKNSFCSIVSRLWNRLPDEVRNAGSLEVFKDYLNNVELDIDIFYC